MGLNAAVTGKVVAFLCGDEIGMTSPEEMLKLDEATLQRVDQLLPMLKREDFRAAVAKLKAEADAASAAADAEAAAEAAAAAAWREANPEAAAAAAGKKARQALSPEQKEELDKQLNDAAAEEDPANVLKLIGDGGDIEWQHADDVSD